MHAPAQPEAQAGRAAAGNAPTSAEAAAQPTGAASTGRAMTGTSPPTTQAHEQSAGAQGQAVRSEQAWEHAWEHAEREFPVGAVAVYTVTIEMPADTALAASEAATEKRPTYRGAERRVRSQAYAGADRRRPEGTIHA
jgi:hypothetical protein